MLASRGCSQRHWRVQRRRRVDRNQIDVRIGQ